jgi:hypothetical protein
MTFDNQEHKQIVQQLINQAQFRGEHCEQALALKRAVDSAVVTPVTVHEDCSAEPAAT